MLTFFMQSNSYFWLGSTILVSVVASGLVASDDGSTGATKDGATLAKASYFFKASSQFITLKKVLTYSRFLF